jgi:hypothetical protein
MTIDPFLEHPEPDPDDHADPALEAEAHAALEQWLRDHPAVPGEIKETVRAETHLNELTGRADAADRVAADADEKEASLLTKHDPAGHRVLGFTIGAALVIMLVVLDAVPLNWAAQAFGLDSTGTWLVTLILVVASIGAMLGFEMTQSQPRRRAVLATVVGAGYVALLGLRTDFLTTVASESFLVALLQSALLTAISAGLVLCGAVVLGRTRTLSLSRSRAEARRARQATEAAHAEQNRAAERLQRHLGALRQMLLPWALGSAAPDGADRAKWAAALERAIRQLFPAS